MNERFKELLYEAWNHVDGHATNGQRYVIMDEDESINQKFAELIVKECAERCECIGTELHSNGSYTGDIAFKCAVDLKKYFGVEE